MKNRKRDPLARARQVQRAAARQGFDWPKDDPRTWAKLAEEIRELKAVAKDPRKAGEELGDLLFMVVNLARYLDLDPSAALRGASAKFRQRFEYILRHRGKLPPLKHPRRLAAMERLWREAKKKGL